MAVLDEYHRLLATTPVEVRVQFLHSGFMPRGEAALIEAGIRCVPFLSAWSGDEGAHSPNDSAASRLNAILSRLRVVGQSREAKTAVDELSNALAQYRKRRVLIYLAVFGGLVGVILLGLIAAAILG